MSLGLQHYDCTECGLSVNSLAQLQQHFTGRKHTNTSKIYHKANMPSIARSDDSKSTCSTLASKSINIAKLGHQNVLNKTKQYAMGHVLATVLPQYNSRNKVMKKYPSKVNSDSSNMSLVAASQMEAIKSVHLGSVNIYQKQKEQFNSQWHSKDSNGNITDKLPKDSSITSFDYNHKSITQYSVLHSQSNLQQSFKNFSIENILQTEYKSVHKTNDSNCIQRNSSELHMVTESINSVKLPSFPKSTDQHEHIANLNKENDKRHFKSSRFTEQDIKPVISVRKDLINTVDSSKSIKHVGQSSNQAHLQTMGASIFKSKSPSQDAKLVHGLNSNTQTSQIECTTLISAPLAPLDDKNHISMQNIANIPPSFVSNLKMKNVDESLKCYTCKKGVLDSAGKSLSLIYDHLFFGRASCKRCSKKVSCSGFSKLKQGNSDCCKPDQLVYSNIPVYYLIGELGNCDKNPRYYLAEYMMKLKLLWIYGPWHQAIKECKEFIKYSHEIPSYIFKGWDNNLSPKQTTSFKKQKKNVPTEETLFEDREMQKENTHTGKEPLKDKDMQKVKTDTGRGLLKIKEIQENAHTGKEPLKDMEIQKVNAPTGREPKKDIEIQKRRAQTRKEPLNEKLIPKGNSHTGMEPMKDKEILKGKAQTRKEPLNEKLIQKGNSHTGMEPIKDKEILKGKAQTRKEPLNEKLIQKANSHTGMEPIKNKEIKKEKAHTGKETLKNKGKVKTIKKEYTNIKRSLTDADDEENQMKNLPPPAKKSKISLRTFRIKEEVIDISSENCDSSGINCTEPNNESKTDLDCVLDEVIEFFGHMQKEDEIIFPNFATNNQKQSKAFTVNNETFAPKIIEVCSIKNLENTFTNHVDNDVEDNYELEKYQISFNAKDNMKDNTNNTSFHSGQYDETVIFDNSILEQSCGSTIMTPDASPVNDTKLAAAPMLSVRSLSSSLTKLNSFQGNISVSKYIKDVSRINSNCLVSLKTIEECPMCYIKLSISNMTVNTNNLVLKFVCTCDLQIHILPNINGKVVWPFTDKENKPSECVQRRDEKVPKKRQLLLSYFFR